MPLHVSRTRRLRAPVLGVTMIGAGLLAHGATAAAAVVATVPLATTSGYAVLGASTVTNTGNSTLDGSLGLWPGSSVTGFPPGLVIAPGATDTTNAAAEQAQSNLTIAYVNAAGRPVDATTTADLVNLSLQPGVYAGPDKSPLSLTGPLVLDGAGDVGAVFIFQTDSTLITGSGSTVTLINGAQECNVFWQVGSSATLGSGSVFVGNVMALASVTVNTGVTVRGRALARNGAVTLDNDTFTKPTCLQPTTDTSTTTTGATATTATSVPPGDTRTPTFPGPTGTPSSAGGPTDTPFGGGTARSVDRATPGTTPGSPSSGPPDFPVISGPPRTGGAPLRTSGSLLPVVLLAGLVGVGAPAVAVATGPMRRRRRPSMAL